MLHSAQPRAAHFNPPPTFNPTHLVSQLEALQSSPGGKKECSVAHPPCTVYHDAWQLPQKRTAAQCSAHLSQVTRLFVKSLAVPHPAVHGLFHIDCHFVANVITHYNFVYRHSYYKVANQTLLNVCVWLATILCVKLPVLFYYLVVFYQSLLKWILQLATATMRVSMW